MVSLLELIGSYQNSLNELRDQDLEGIAKILLDARQVFTAGNGGSATTASHFAADLRRVGIPSISLSDSTAVVTALANDLGYEYIFAKQLANIQPGDVLVAISVSGRSRNIVKAVEFARRRGAMTIGFTGFGGGELGNLCERGIILRDNNFGLVEAIHLCVCHLLRSMVR